jgi:hypothetical protein
VTAGPDEVKACCAAAYSRDAVALVLGESYHPGGLALTRRLADALKLRAGDRVVDVASGPGATARLLAVEYGVTVDGIDLGADSVRRASAAAADAGLSGQVRFRLGDAERLPLPDETADAVVCECALCTFPGKEEAVAEFARVLRPGGRVGLTDVTLAVGRLPGELTTLAAWVACIAGARPARGYADLIESAGLRVIRAERHDDAIDRMAEQAEARVRVLRMTGAARLAEAGIDADEVLRYAALVRQAVADGSLGYSLLVAEKP